MTNINKKYNKKKKEKKIERQSKNVTQLFKFTAILKYRQLELIIKRFY